MISLLSLQWKACKTSEGQTYYYNIDDDVTETAWQLPRVCLNHWFYFAKYDGYSVFKKNHSQLQVRFLSGIGEQALPFEVHYLLETQQDAFFFIHSTVVFSVTIS